MLDKNLSGSSLFGRREILSRSEYLKYGGLALLFLLLIVLYVFEFKQFNLTFNARGLVIASFLVGAALGSYLGYRFRENGEDLTEKVQIYVFFIFICMIFMPLFGSLSNRLAAPGPVKQQEVSFVEERAFYSSRFGVMEGEEIRPTAYYVFFYYKDKLRRIESKAPLFPAAERGDTVNIPVKRGLWGFEFVVIR